MTTHPGSSRDGLDGRGSSDGHDSFDGLDSLDLTTTWDAGDARIRLAGDLDWDTAGQLLRAATDCLGADPAPRRLRLDCTRLTLCDSMGLSTLLMIHRSASGAGVRLHLDHQPAVLRRMLRTTGTDHLFPDAAADSGSSRSPAPGEPDRTATTLHHPPPQP